MNEAFSCVIISVADKILKKAGAKVQKILYFIFDLFCSLPLLLVFFDSFQFQFGRNHKEIRIFRLLCAVTFIALIYGTVRIYFTDKSFEIIGFTDVQNVFAFGFERLAQVAFVFLWQQLSTTVPSMCRFQRRTFSILFPMFLFIVLCLTIYLALDYTNDIIPLFNIHKAIDHTVLLFVLICILYPAVASLKTARQIDCRSATSLRRRYVMYPLVYMCASISQSFFLQVPLCKGAAVLLLLAYHLETKNQQLMHDTLTPLFNRNGYLKYVTKKSFRHKGKIHFFMMIDADGLKRINDSYGHPEGDRLIRTIAQVILSAADRQDFAARLSGDEFVIIGHRDAAEELEKFSRHIDIQMQAAQALFSFPVSISKGYVIIKTGDSVADAYRTADIRMYDNKRKRKGKEFANS